MGDLPTNADLQGVKLTEDYIATCFVKRYEGQFAYDHDKGCWYQFDNAIWRPSRTPDAFHAMRELVKYASSAAKTETSMQKVRFVKGAEEFSRSDPRMARTSDAWNRDPFLLGTPGGTVDLQTGRLRPSLAADNISRATAVEPAKTVDCPKWLRFLEEATGGDFELIQFLRQICGYSLTADTREQALFFFHGPGGNGKGVFLNTVSRIMGDYHAAATMEVLTSTRVGGATTDLAMLNGARFVSASETEEGVPWAEARLKRITGGDPITARFMRQDNVTFTPVFKLVVIGNHKPSLKSPDEAMRRRFNIIPFTVQPTAKDRQLEKRLEKEWPGILRWMIEGCLDWQKNGLSAPRSVKEATWSYFEEQDTLGHWLETKCIIGKEHSNPFTPLFHSWRSFATSVGENPGTGKTFAEALQKSGYTKTRSKNGMVYQGLKLSYDEPEGELV